MSSRRAKIFKNGGSQAVRLPQSCRFPDGCTEVAVHREGAKIILEPLGWPESFLKTLGSWHEVIERPSFEDEPPRDPFDE